MVGYIPRDINTPYGVTEIHSSVNLRNSLSGTPPNSYGSQEKELRRNTIHETLYCLPWNYSGGKGFEH